MSCQLLSPPLPIQRSPKRAKSFILKSSARTSAYLRHMSKKWQVAMALQDQSVSILGRCKTMLSNSGLLSSLSLRLARARRIVLRPCMRMWSALSIRVLILVLVANLATAALLLNSFVPRMLAPLLSQSGKFLFST